jgi:hypothetical protein
VTGSGSSVGCNLLRCSVRKVCRVGEYREGVLTWGRAGNLFRDSASFLAGLTVSRMLAMSLLPPSYENRAVECSQELRR